MVIEFQSLYKIKYMPHEKNYGMARKRGGAFGMQK